MRTPSPVRKAVREPIWAAANALARPTARFRVLPDYLIIGAQRCGTTSLQDTLTDHPNVASSRLMKGVHYFDTAYPKGLDWYRSHFPTRSAVDRVRRRTGTPLRVGEASPYYVFHPAALSRIAVDVPDAKLLLLLRDPVERTISHHKHETRRGNETLPLLEALEAEPDRLAGEAERVLADPGYNSFPLQTWSYASRSRYGPQVRRLYDLFPRQQIMVVASEDLFHEPGETVAQIFEFLEVPPHEPAAFPRMNATKSKNIDDVTRRRLAQSFRESNEEVFDLVGRRFPWQ